jgi:hypothetical protein
VIRLEHAGGVGAVEVEFDAYVPLTITWQGASEILEPPRYVEIRNETGYLELKVHPSSGMLIEVVLAAASKIQVQQGDLSPDGLRAGDLIPFIEPGDDVPEAMRVLVVKAYSDYLYVSFGPEIDHWVGSDPVLFGVSGERDVTAVCARWTSSERALVLAES